MTKSSSVQLSICIGTFNRGNFIGQALDSIVAQMTNNCEIVVSDNASTDNTEQVVSAYAQRFDRLRYVKHDTNMGFDRNFDCAVELAQGKYCWLFSDDDLLKPGAVSAVLRALDQDYSLILVNGEHRDFSMSKVRVPSFFGIDSDRVYPAGDIDHLFAELGTCLMCICCVVIRRDIWLSRERRRYYGSWFIHVGIIMQEPLPGETLVIAKPYMSFRLDNKQLHATFDVWLINWPSIVWSFPIAEARKRAFCVPDPWKRFRYLIGMRAVGTYSITEYRRWIRPRVRSFPELLTPAMVAILPCIFARLVYQFCSSVSDWPTSPHNATETMIPASLRELRDRFSSRTGDESACDG